MGRVHKRKIYRRLYGEHRRGRESQSLIIGAMAFKSVIRVVWLQGYEN